MRREYTVSNKTVIEQVLAGKTDSMKLDDAVTAAKAVKTLDRKDVDAGWKAGFRTYANVYEHDGTLMVKPKTGVQA